MHLPRLIGTGTPHQPQAVDEGPAIVLPPLPAAVPVANVDAVDDGPAIVLPPLPAMRLPALLAEHGVDEAQAANNLAVGIEEALAVAAPLPILVAPPPPPPTYTSVLTDIATRHGGPMLSLSLVDLPDDLPGWILRDYAESPHTYTACHEIAAKLNTVLGTGAPTSRGGNIRSADGRRAIELAQTAIDSRDAVIQIKYKHPRGDGHSFTLVSTEAGVESLEGWAGANERYAYPIHECLDRPRTDITHDRANEALGLMRTPRQRLRGAALNQISRAGLPGFEAHYRHCQMEIEVTVRRLDTPENVRGRLEGRVADTQRKLDGR